MTSYTQPNFADFKYDEKRYLSQFESEMFEIPLNNAPQYDLNSSVTMATYWVPDPPILKAFLATFGIPF